ncbi:MAG TPA: hypothetical protein DCF33_04095 [Saprospirales bacterium]|nr:hypothetical protein [Saprospirales bacterium]
MGGGRGAERASGWVFNIKSPVEYLEFCGYGLFLRSEKMYEYKYLLLLFVKQLREGRWVGFKQQVYCRKVVKKRIFTQWKIYGELRETLDCRN